MKKRKQNPKIDQDLFDMTVSLRKQVYKLFIESHDSIRKLKYLNITRALDLAIEELDALL